jgi:hypothetical protein
LACAWGIRRSARRSAARWATRDADARQAVGHLGGRDCPLFFGLPEVIRAGATTRSRRWKRRCRKNSRWSPGRTTAR